MQKEEKKLVYGVLSGSEEALYKLYKKYKSPLTLYVQKKVGERQDVEEIVQDIFMSALEGFRDFRFNASINTYLLSIAKRKIADFYRKKKLKKIVFSQLPFIEPFVALFTTPEDELDEQLLKEKIHETFQKLPRRYQKILKLKYIDNYTVMQIAKTLNVSFKSVESMLFRARTAFVRVYNNT